MTASQRMLEFAVFVIGCWVCTSGLFAMVWIVARTLAVEDWIVTRVLGIAGEDVTDEQNSDC